MRITFPGFHFGGPSGSFRSASFCCGFFTSHSRGMALMGNEFSGDTGETEPHAFSPNGGLMEPVRVPRYGAAGAFIKLAAGAGVRYGAGQKYFKNSTRTPHHYGAGNDGP